MSTAAPRFTWRGMRKRFLHGDSEIEIIIRFLVLAVAIGELFISLAEAQAQTQSSTSELAFGRLMLSLLDIALLLTIVLAPRVGATAVKLVSIVLLLGGIAHLQSISIAALAAALVLISKRMYRWYISLTLVYMGPVIVVTFRGAPEMLWYSLSVYTLSWVTVSFLGFGFALAQSRLERETARRVADMRVAEQTLMQTRLRFALDTHDTVSHALARESATLRLALRASGLPAEGAALIRSAAEANTEAQRSLRELLARLNATAGQPEDSLDLAKHLAISFEAMKQEMAQLEVALTSSYSVPTVTAARRDIEAVESILKELGTNIVKHADLTRPVEVHVDTVQGRTLRFTARNIVSNGKGFAPRSISARAKSLGGQCFVEKQPVDASGARRVTVRVELPLPSDQAELQEAVPLTNSARDFVPK